MKFTHAVSALAVLMLSGCATGRYVKEEARWQLTGVEADVSGSGQILSASPSGPLSYEDARVAVEFDPKPTQIEFLLTNKSDSNIKVIWDEAVYIDEQKVAHPVMHAGVRFIDRTGPKPPSVVVRGGKLDDLIAPTDYVSSLSTSWISDPLIKLRSTTAQPGQPIYEANSEPVTVGVLLPVEVGGQRIDYTFTFTVRPEWPAEWRR